MEEEGLGEVAVEDHRPSIRMQPWDHPGELGVHAVVGMEIDGEEGHDFCKP